MNAFNQWFDAGYHELVPVVPPDAHVLPDSYVAKGKGKAPGMKFPSGLWGGFKGWSTHQVTATDLVAWHAWEASVGLRFGQALMLDLDVYDQATADEIERLALELLGPAPLRVGQWPKRALLYANDGSVKPRRLRFAGKKGELNLVEVPPQVVVQGTHAKTGKPYYWPRQPVPLAQLSVVTGDKLDAFLDVLRHKLPSAAIEGGGGGPPVNPELLRGNPELIAEIMGRLPNHADMRWHYMIKLGYAVKAALPNDEGLAFDLWDEWCSRWADTGYDADGQRHRWDSLTGSARVGAAWVYDEGKRLLGEDFEARALLWNGAPLKKPDGTAFDDGLEDDENPFHQPPEGNTDDLFQVVRVAELTSRQPPKMLIARHLPEQSLGFIYGEPGSFKSFLLLDMALSIAAGFATWQGGEAIATDAESVVVLIVGEGSFGLRNRILAWCQHFGVDMAVIDRRLMIIEQPMNFMQPNDIAKLLRTVRRAIGKRPCLIGVDTVSRALPGADENLQKDMTLFVRACDALKAAFQCCVVGIHHAGKSGDMRGSTVLRGAGDFVLRMSRSAGAQVVELTCEKQKELPDGWSESFLVSTVTLAPTESSLVLERSELTIGPDAVLTPELTQRILDAMRAAWDAGAPWAKTPQAKERYAIRRLIADFAFKPSDAESALSLWEKSGLIVFGMVDTNSKKMGYRVSIQKDENANGGGIFD